MTPSRPDIAFLAAIALGSTATSVLQLGFYSDDWALLARLAHAPDQSLWSLGRALFDSHSNLRMRPLHVVYQVLVFKAFGLNPAGYHVLQALLFAVLGPMLYVLLLELRTPRAAALAIPTVFTLVPNYSTVRLWIASFHYVPAFALWLLGTYACVRALRSDRPLAWSLSGLAALAVAVLGVELVLPLVAVLPIALWWTTRAHQRERLPRTISVLLLGGPLVLCAAAVLYRAATSEGASAPDVHHLVTLVVGALAVNAGTFGVALPHTVVWSASRLSWVQFALGGVLCLLVFRRLSSLPFPAMPRRRWALLAGTGGAVAALATAIFIGTPRIQYWSVGIANRVWMGTAIGAAIAMVGAAGWLGARFARSERGARFFGAAVAAVCAAGFVINTALASYWIEAWHRQWQVLQTIGRALPQIPPGTTLLLHGVCPYVGPAPVFESDWDLAGAVQVAYGDPTLRADVAVGRRFSVGPDGVRTERRLGSPLLHPFGERLRAFDVRTARVTALVDATAARLALSSPVACPDGGPDRGEVLLPFDRVSARFLRRAQRRATSDAQSR